MSLTDDQIKEIRDANSFDTTCNGICCNCKHNDPAIKSFKTQRRICIENFNKNRIKKSKCEDCANELIDEYCRNCTHYEIIKKDKLEPVKKLVKKEIEIWIDESTLSWSTPIVFTYLARSGLVKAKLIYEVEE